MRKEDYKEYFWLIKSLSNESVRVSNILNEIPIIQVSMEHIFIYAFYKKT